MSEALQLADAIDPLTRKSLDNLTCASAATELRRLHEENEGRRESNEWLIRKCDELYKLNAELVEALRSLITATEGVSINDYNEEAHDIAVSRARAALTKAGESK